MYSQKRNKKLLVYTHIHKKIVHTTNRNAIRRKRIYLKMPSYNIHENAIHTILFPK